MSDEQGSDDADPDVSQHVHAKVSPEKKVRWLEYAKEHHRGNLSSLVVESVDKTISDEWVLASDDSAEDEVNVDLSELDDDLSEIKSQLSALTDQVDSVTVSKTEPEGYEELERDELLKLSNQVRSVLPTVPSGWALVNVIRGQDLLVDSDKPESSGSAEDIADHLDENRYHVHDAAVYLENSDHTVESVLDDGTRRWYIKNPNIQINDDIEEPEVSREEFRPRSDQTREEARDQFEERQ